MANFRCLSVVFFCNIILFGCVRNIALAVASHSTMPCERACELLGMPESRA
jgi:hypothetical protein